MVLPSKNEKDLKVFNQHPCNLRHSRRETHTIQVVIFHLECQLNLTIFCKDISLIWKVVVST